MKMISFWSRFIVLLAVCAPMLAVAAEPKKLLVVTVTTGFRHSSIATAERILKQLGEESGVYTVVDFAQQPTVKVPQKPGAPQKPKELAADADAQAKAKYQADLAKFEAAETKYKTDLEKWNSMQAEVKAAQEEYNQALRQSLEKLSPENLKKYDGVVFANTTGDLPLPDKNGFIDWVRNGGALMGMHSASDTFHEFRPYVEMLGGEFLSHGAQVEVEAINQDKEHPACKHLDSTFKVFDEIYIMKSFQRSAVHGLLTLDKEPNKKTPGDYPIAWCKEFGKGKVFYTSLGHREDVWDPNEKNRKNSKEVAEAYQKHILGGIKWALGLEKGDATPQVK